LNHRTRVTLQFVKSHPKRRTKKIIAALFILLIVGWVASVAYQVVTYNNLASKPEKPCPVILVPENATKPVFSIYYFTQSGCDYCTKQTPAISDIAKSHDVTIINLTTDSNGAALIKQYNVTTTPTVIIFRNNVEVKRFNTVQSEATLLAALK
jgi:glutaredoxin